ncbi:hydroxyproline dehydrogenase-like [Chiloscyllium punctatum]|uniref:hydroxyproline dehydrogenase-like n=1 Tax=Chiloscyllium punctatum TaxID=137246 RepID=UPI003B636A5C
MTVCRKVLGKGIFNRLLKATAYGQFVAGETLPEIQRTLSKLSQLGIRPLLAVPIEEDVGERTRDSEMESCYDQHLQRMLNCVDLSTGSCPQPMMQLKVTALMSAGLCKTLTLALRKAACAQDLVVHRLVEVMEGKDLTFHSLSDSDSVHFHHSLRRLEKIGRVGHSV